MTDEVLTINDELIDIPSTLNQDYGIALAADCSNPNAMCATCLPVAAMVGSNCATVCQPSTQCGSTCIPNVSQAGCASPIAECGQIPSCGVCQIGGQCGTCMSVSQRPANFAWTTNVAVGNAVPNVNGKLAYLTAAEWNTFTARINAFRVYKGLAAVSFSEAITGEPMLASQAEAARSAISEMSPPSPLPASITAGKPITAAYINGLVASLNSIT